MKFSFNICVVLTLLILACQNNSGRSIGDLFARYNEDRLKLFPLDATQAGDNRYNDLLPNDITESFRAELRSFYSRYKEQLLQYDRNGLPENDQISYDVLLWDCDINLEQLNYPMHLLPVNQFNSLHLNIGQLAGGTGAQPFVTVEDYDNWLRRLASFVEWCNTAMTNMRQGIEQGYTLPKELTAKVIPQMAYLAEGPAESHLFYSPINLLPASFSPDEKQRLTDAYRGMIEDNIIPVFGRFHQFLIDEYLPASRETDGISAIPNGKAYYDLQIRVYTTTSLTADEIFELGQSEVKRITGEMEKVKRQIGFKGDLNAFFDHVRTHKDLMPYTEPEQVLDNFNEIHAKMKPNLKKLFSMAPKSAFEIRRTEAFREASASAEYSSGSTDGTRPGIFYVPIPNVLEYNILSDEDLFLHEAIPGHHYQISLQQENKNLPEFRRTLYYSAFGEGWALYSESLGKELGLYTDPYQYFGMLSAEMHRAIRLVVDSGIHSKGWTREQAIQYSLDHEAESEAGIVAEIERYMSWPGQALSYKIGQLKIRELRSKAENALGEKFDVGEFHSKVLESGNVPLTVLDSKINTWIDSQIK